VFRFDDPLGVYGVCYLGLEPMAAFVETFLRDLPARAVSRRFLASRVLTECALVRDVWLARAYGSALARLGTTAALSGANGPGGSYEHAQRWSRALHDHPQRPAGIRYRSSHDDDLGCVALFDCRAGDAVRSVRTLGTVDGQIGLLVDAVRRYRIRLL
jgi:hypothetical protein